MSLLHLCWVRRGWECSLRWRNSDRALYGARHLGAPAGAKGWFRVSMYQIASVSLRAIVIWAIRVPRCLPARFLVDW